MGGGVWTGLSVGPSMWCVGIVLFGGKLACVKGGGEVLDKFVEGGNVGGGSCDGA